MKLLSVNVGRPRPNPWKGLEPDLLPRLPAAGALPPEVKELARKRSA